MEPYEIASETPPPQTWFATTHWSVVLASQQSNSDLAFAALEELCQRYWYPLYAFVRRQGRSPEDAQDLTQAFFERLLAHNYLASVDQRKGKFRSFLLASMTHFLCDAHDRASRLKRGGGAKFIYLDEQNAENRYSLEPVDHCTAEKLFERRWALTVLERALERLAREYESKGQLPFFQRAREFLQGVEAQGSYANAAAELGMTEGALRVAIHRMRRRYGELLRHEIAETVTTPLEVEEEINHLMASLS